MAEGIPDANVERALFLSDDGAPPEEVEAGLRRAVELDDDGALYYYAGFLAGQGREEEALACFHRAAEAGSDAAYEDSPRSICGGATSPPPRTTSVRASRRAGSAPCSATPACSARRAATPRWPRWHRWPRDSEELGELTEEARAPTAVRAFAP
ncbi:hypothetical protein DP939_43975 [Spongiactinospora rosea]|uniref:Tetratricopeptide repeat protein n=1 Tax=Spongiactinospora rosea TaxID=2248750 RepID=A0A366LIR8_9ACTN|nr:hypothetical protein [Spongiactinospora rosea]RBQ13798.1 hypothetical protein DP939_43975 [Spongiactinospora rosea]